MSASSPAPPAGSWRRFLARSAAAAKMIAILLVTAVALRFVTASVRHALAVTQGNLVERPAPHAETAARTTGSASPSPSVRPAPPAPSGVPGQPRSVTLGVSAGPPRSDVYVNGSKVGQTPFLGDTSCKVGQQIRIEIVPPKGAPLTYLRRCVGGALEVDGPPP